MASLTTGDVSILGTTKLGDQLLKDKVMVRAALTLKGQGGATNKIPASVFGLSCITECSNLYIPVGDEAINTGVFPATPAVDGTYIVLAGIVEPVVDTDPTVVNDVAITPNIADVGTGVEAGVVGYITVHGWA